MVPCNIVSRLARSSLSQVFVLYRSRTNSPCSCCLGRLATVVWWSFVVDRIVSTTWVAHTITTTTATTLATKEKGPRVSRHRAIGVNRGGSVSDRKADVRWANAWARQYQGNLRPVTPLPLPSSATFCFRSTNDRGPLAMASSSRPDPRDACAGVAAMFCAINRWNDGEEHHSKTQFICR